MSLFGGQQSKSSFSFGSSSPFGTTGTGTAPHVSSPLFNSFAPSGSTAAGSTSASGSVSATNDMAVDGPVGDYDNDDEYAEVLYLDPPAYTRGDKAKWKASGRVFRAAASAVSGEIVGWTTKEQSGDDKPTQAGAGAASAAAAQPTVGDRVIHVASINAFAASEQRMYAETYTLFLSLQKIVASAIRLPDTNDVEMWDPAGGILESLLGPPSAETVSHMNRLVSMYLEEVSKLRTADGLDEEKRARYDSVFHAFNLAQILYLPRDGRGESLVGEELLDWVNAVDTVHINDQGNAIMGAKNSWEQESFFPFIVRCVLRGFFQPAALLLRTLEKHPHPPIARLGTKLAASVESFPRSTSVDAYPLDHQFIAAHKLWLAQFRADLATFEGGRGRGHWFDDGGAGRSAWASWEDDFRSVTELLEGKTERLFAEVADWREALGAWGVLIDVSLRRDDLPRALARIVDELPIDSTVIEDSIHASLCSGDIIKVLMDAYTLDRWLAAHLGDVFDKLALIPDDDEHFDTSLRDYYLLDYADMLQESSSQPELWRVICEYLAAAGEQGRSRLRAYIVHVGGMTSKPRKGDMVDEDEDEDQSAAQFERFTELREVCAEYKLEDEWRTISKTVAESLIRRGDLGVAASICLTSEDGYQLSRIAEKIMAAFVTSGEAEFQRLVNSLPESMLHEAPQKFTELHLGGAAALDDDSLRAPSRTTMVMFASRLAFLSEFRDYLLYLDQGSRDLAAKKLVNLLTSGITPVEFWGVLLAQSIDLLEDSDILLNSAETFELIRVVEEVLENATFAPQDYLEQLWRYLERQPKTNGTAATNGATKTNGNGAVAKKEDRAADIEAAQRCLEVVRLALARNLSRALVHDSAF